MVVAWVEAQVPLWVSARQIDAGSKGSPSMINVSSSPASLRQSIWQMLFLLAPWSQLRQEAQGSSLDFPASAPPSWTADAWSRAFFMVLGLWLTQAPAPRGAAGPVEGGERLVGAVLMAETA